MPVDGGGATVAGGAGARTAGAPLPACDGRGDGRDDRVGLGVARAGRRDRAVATARGRLARGPVVGRPGEAEVGEGAAEAPAAESGTELGAGVAGPPIVASTPRAAPPPDAQDARITVPTAAGTTSSRAHQVTLRRVAPAVSFAFASPAGMRCELPSPAPGPGQGLTGDDSSRGKGTGVK
jgi:hypothetical protein